MSQLIDTARVAPEKQGPNVPLPAASPYLGVSSLEIQMAYIPYSERLKDPRWQKKRLERLEIADWMCESCGAKDKTLHVHHRKYRKGAAPWEYTNDQLEVLCEGCHERHHGTKKSLEDAIAALEEHDLDRILGYAQGILASGYGYDDAKVRLLNHEHAEGVSDAVIGSLHAADELINLRDADECVSRERLHDFGKKHRLARNS